MAAPGLRRLTLLLAAGLLHGACGRRPAVATHGAIAADCDPSRPGASLPAAKRDSLPPLSPVAHRTIDEVSADIARQVPGGYAGIYVEGERLVVLLVDTTRRDAALAALAPRLRDAYRGRDFLTEHALVRRARWDFAQLHEWYRYLGRHAWGSGGVYSSGIDERENRIRYGVRDAAAKRRLEELVAALGAPCGLVTVEIREPARIR